MDIIDSAAEYGSNVGVFIVVAVIGALCVLYVAISKGLNMARTSHQTVSEMKKEYADKVLEEKEKAQRISGLEGWTDRQQVDLANAVGAITVLMLAMQAVIKFVISQGANGECHRAQDSIDKYIEDKMNQTLSSQKSRTDRKDG